MREADSERLTDLAIPYLQTAGFVSSDNGKIDRNRVKSIVDAVRGNMACLSQIAQETDIFFKDAVISEDHVKLLTSETCQSILAAFYAKLQKLDSVSPDIFKEMLKSVQKETKVGGKGLYMPIRIALTGREHGPELYSIANILGVGGCRKRIERFLERG